MLKEQLAHLYDWIIDRETARVGRQNGYDKPWTDNKVIQKYKFCNVRRMDDRVSKWLLMNWYPHDASYHNYLMAAAMARLINWPDTLDYVSGGKCFEMWHRKTVEKRLLAWQAKGKKVFTGAYIINGALGGNKVLQITRVLDNIHFADLKAKGIIKPDSMERTWKGLNGLIGIGSFMAGQIVADLRYTRALDNPNDCMTWAPMGPGSKRGMLRLLTGKPEGKLNQQKFEENLLLVIDRVKLYCGVVYADRKLEAMDIQNCLCEFDKYMRVINGEGKPRSLYPGLPE